MNGMLATLPFVQSGKLKVIGVSKATRVPLLPDVPTIAEQGVAGFESGTWQGLLVPAGTPHDVVARLSAELTRIIRSPEIRSRLTAQGAEVYTMTPAEFVDLLRPRAEALGGRRRQRRRQDRLTVGHVARSRPMKSPDPYRAFPNSFKRRLLAGETLIGCWCSLANPITTEVLGIAGFDWLLLDGEHSPNDVTTFIPQLMALKDSASAPVVRPSWNDAVEIKRLLDAGFYNFLVPFVQTAEDARRAVAATRYPPAGIRGVSVAQRNNRFGTVADYFRDIDAQITVLVQIESRAGPRRGRRDRGGRRRRRHVRRPVRPRRGARPPRQPRRTERAGGDRPGVRGRQGGRQADRHPDAGRGRRAPLPGDGRELRRRRQRPRHLQERDAAAPRSLCAKRLSQPSISSSSFDLSNTLVAPSCWHLTRISGVA